MSFPMKVGKTFIQIVDNEQPVVVVADEAIDGAVEPQAQRDRVGTGSKKQTVPYGLGIAAMRTADNNAQKPKNDTIYQTFFSVKAAELLPLLPLFLL